MVELGFSCNVFSLEDQKEKIMNIIKDITKMLLCFSLLWGNCIGGKLTHPNMQLVDAGLQQNPQYVHVLVNVVTTIKGIVQKIAVYNEAKKKTADTKAEDKHSEEAISRTHKEDVTEILVENGKENDLLHACKIELFDPIAEFLGFLHKYQIMLKPLVLQSLNNEDESILYSFFFCNEKKILNFFDDRITSIALLQQICDEFTPFASDMIASLSRSTRLAYCNYIKKNHVK